MSVSLGRWRAATVAVVAATTCALPSPATGATARPAPVARTAPAVRPAPMVVSTPPPVPRSDAVPGRPGTDAGGTHAARHSRLTRVLVILAYWGSKHDDITPTLARTLTITRADAYYRAASYGQQRITGSVTPWVKVATQNCGDFSVFGPARAAATRLGFRPSSYSRVIVYEPCDAGFFIGLGDEPGSKVLLMARGMTLPTAVHEQGHNYGIDHANLLSCRRRGSWVTYAAGATCTREEYADYSSAMALQWDPTVAGDFTAPQKAYLGWLTGGRLRTLRGSGTVTLSPYETGRHTVALKVPGSAGRTYWAEYRTPAGNDRHLPSGFFGVVLHLSRSDGSGPMHPNQSLLLDVLPTGSAVASLSDRIALPPGSSWTSPDGVRFTVASQTASRAVVRVTRGQHTHAPGRPGRVSARAGDTVASVSFRRAADNGDVIRNYRVTAQPGGRAVTVRNYTGAATLTARIGGLRNGVAYRFSVTAVNEVGRGGAATSAAVTPKPALPSVRIVSPAPRAAVSGLVTITVAATPNPTTRKPIDHVDVSVDGHLVGSVTGRTGAVQWDTGTVGNHSTGAHTVTARAVDSNNRSATRSEPVTVTTTTAPGLTITAPAAGATVRGTLTVTGAVVRNGPDALGEVDLYVDGAFADLATPSRGTYTLTWDASTATVGAHTVKVVATDAAGRSTALSRAVTVAHEKPAVTVTAPAVGAQLYGTTPLAAIVKNNWAPADDTIEFAVTDPAGDLVYYDQQDLGTLAHGGSATATSSWDTSSLTPGKYTVTVTVTDPTGVSTQVARAVTVVHPLPVAAVTGPADHAQVKGVVPIGVSVTNPSSAQDLSAQVTVTDASGVTVFGDYPFYPAVAHGAAGTSTSQWDTSGLTPGTYTIAVTATDATGASGATATRTVTVVHPAPVITVTSPAAGASVQGSVRVTITVQNAFAATTVSFSASSDDGSVYGSGQYGPLAEGATATFDQTYDVSGASSGPHVLTVDASDDYAVTAEKTVSYTVR